MNFSKIFLSTAVIGAAAIALASCSKPAQQEKQAPVPTSAVTVSLRKIPLVYEYAGRITAYRQTEVRARVGGILLHRNFVEGAEVKQGDILFEIDPDTYTAEVARAKAAVAQAEATYEQSVRDANRAEELVVQRVQSTAQRDQAFATRDANAASLQQAKAQLRVAELNLEYTKVTAPISGLTSREAVSEGSLIGTDSTSSLLTTITQLDPVYVSFSFADKEAVEIRELREAMQQRGEEVPPLSVTISFGDGSSYGKQGVVDFTSPTIDPQTGTLAVRAVLENKERRLVPGQFVRVNVHGVTMANATVIPEQALMQNNSMQYVYVAAQKEMIIESESGDKTVKTVTVAELRPVSTLRQLKDRSWLIAPLKESTETVALTKAEQEEIVKIAELKNQPKPDPVPTTHEVIHRTGLQPNEQVITEGQYRLMMAQGRVAVLDITTLDGKVVEKTKKEGDANQPAKGQ